MGFIRPATPGFIATLTATILLAVVSFCVPYFKSVFFLKADATVGGVNATVTFGTLGYCLELNGNVTCSKPSVGYELDINSLVGNNSPIQIPQVAVKWITYVLVLHIVALVFAAGSAVFGLLAHVREMSMMCCSTCVSGFAAVAALLAFIFDLALFFIAKARINAVGKATIGNAIWLTLAAWVLLFFSGCFYTIGRCCITKRGPRDKWGKRQPEHGEGPGGSSSSRDVYADQMRMDAVKAEEARKNKQNEVGLPAFYESQPLTARVDGDSVYTESYRDNVPQSPQGHGPRPNPSGGYAGGGYMQQPASNRAVDEYYHPTGASAAATSYPPGPRRQGSSHSYATSNYPPSQPPVASPPLSNNNNQYLAAVPRTTTPGREYGHASGGSTYHSAHEQQPSSYSQYDMYGGQSGAYSQPTPPAQGGYNSHATSYYTPAGTPGAAPDRSYTLGGDGYGANSVPPLRERSPSVPAIPDHPSTAGYVPYSTSPPPGMPKVAPTAYDDSPPGYESGTSGIQGAWGKH
ncbi:pali-domain-containing protein [Marasmius fiardii PR-910]|nr:pali-domain-containing protein [Marasmius fiardii PR-910]